MKTVLSIQSAVTIGAVGNTMATMAMNAMGVDINRVDTIHLAAHPGYGIKAGGRLEQLHFDDMISGLIQLEIWHRIDAIMTGYMAAADQAQPIAQLIRIIKEQCPAHPVLVDPAIGDHGRLYVDENVAQAMASHLFDLADILTPNAFELSYFSGLDIQTKDDAITAAKQLLDNHENLFGIAVTGLRFDADGNQVSDGLVTRNDAVFFDKPSLENQPQGLSGGGDLFSAIIMGHYLRCKDWTQAVQAASEDTAVIMAESDHPGQGRILPKTIRDHLLKV